MPMAKHDERRLGTQPTLRRHGPETRLPTRYGDFSLQAYEDDTGALHLALRTGEKREDVLVRIHSECMTGDLFGSMRCDCGPQLHQALTRIGEEGDGLVLYLRQEGRGIGLIGKLHAYTLQDQGFDTVEANEQLGFKADLRDYNIAADMLEDLGVRSVRLLTNNPHKSEALENRGIGVNRLPLVVEPSSESLAYLTTKREKMGHWLP